ncbi:amidohydrolase family protein [Streptomyces sp. PU_AKi4]|uniref:amidohydrolase family protein n=1 Tax=Streptomyces sp. PU_AKi4 TaxID=2800809 RepID=UPI0035238E76
MDELLLTAGRVLPDPCGEILTDGAVHVRTGTIAAVGPREEVELRTPPELPTLSFPDATVLPGLIDAHVHLAFDAGPDPVTVLGEADDEELLSAMTDRAQQLLRSGVTTVRDLGDRNGLAARLRNRIMRQAVAGPRILTATTPLTRPGGHCWFLGGEVAGPESIRALVRRNAGSGADVIKVMVTGGGLTRGGPAVWKSQFTVEELRLVVAEARRFGLPVAAHAHGTEGIAAAVAAGVDTIEHCTWMAEGGGFDLRDEVAADIVAGGIWVCPATHPNWRALTGRVGAERAEEMFSSLRWMVQQGVPVIAGTDAGVPRAAFGGLVDSLEFFAHLGMPLERVITMATTDAARALGIGTRTGLIREGYRADLLVVTGNPLDSLDALRRVRLVLADGRPFPRRSMAGT